MFGPAVVAVVVKMMELLVEVVPVVVGEVLVFLELKVQADQARRWVQHGYNVAKGLHLKRVASAVDVCLSPQS